MKNQGIVFNIERCSYEDGPGIRTTVFLKGCALRCKWCANPESQSFSREILVKNAICVHCGRCMALCPQKYIELKEPYGFITVNNDCGECTKCVDSCYVGARSIQGEPMTPEALCEKLLRDKPYYRKSGGGITFSGGEPLYQIDFLEACAEILRQNEIPVLIETCGQVPTANVRRAMRFASDIFCDLKHMNSEKHKQLTGFGNELILENLRLLDAEFDGNLTVRYPYIPGCNDEKADIEAFLEFACSLKNLKEVCFLPYHRLGIPKYEGLGREYQMGNMPSLKIKDLDFLKDYQKIYPVKISI